MDALSYKTKFVNLAKSEKDWVLVDAENQVAGRLASKVAYLLRGKHKTSFTPHTDSGTNVVIINADKIRFTGKKWDQKEYKNFSLYPGGLRLTTATALWEKDSRRIIERAVKGMLPKNILGRQVYKRLFVYPGADHPHVAQQPETLKF